MGVFFIYILKSSVCLVLFYLFFRLLLSKETFHRFNRMALLGVLFFSLLIPCIEVTTRHQVEVQQAVLSIEQLLLMAELEATPANVGGVQETPCDITVYGKPMTSNSAAVLDMSVLLTGKNSYEPVDRVEVTSGWYIPANMRSWRKGLHLWCTIRR